MPTLLQRGSLSPVNNAILLRYHTALFSSKVKSVKADEEVTNMPLGEGLLNQKEILESANQIGRDRRRWQDDLMDLTKFKLSLLNSVASYTMFLYHAPLAGVGFMPSLAFLFATQTIAMST